MPDRVRHDGISAFMDGHYLSKRKNGNRQMAQLAVYIDDKLARRLDDAGKMAGKSKSKWVAEAIERSLQDVWPEGLFDLAGSWEGTSDPDQIMRIIRTGNQRTFLCRSGQE
jgi:hypothetical protein